MLLVETVRTSPELSLVTFTSAAATLDPEASVTIPERAPVPAVCAAARPGSAPRINATRVTQRKNALPKEVQIAGKFISQENLSIAAIISVLQPIAIKI